MNSLISNILQYAFLHYFFLFLCLALFQYLSSCGAITHFAINTFSIVPTFCVSLYQRYLNSSDIVRTAFVSLLETQSQVLMQILYSSRELYNNELFYVLITYELDY